MAYRDAVLAKSPAYFYEFEADPDTGNDPVPGFERDIVDSTGNGHNGIGRDLATVPGIHAGSATAYQFLRSGASIYPPNVPETQGDTDALTMECWFIPSTIEENPAIIWELGGAERGFNIYMRNADLYVSGWNTQDFGGTKLLRFQTGGLEVGKLYHVVMVFDGPGTVIGNAASMELWLNGTKMGEDNESGFSSAPAFIEAGGIGLSLGSTRIQTTNVIGSEVIGEGFNFSGIIDGVALYRRALTGAEIADNYDQGNQPFEQPGIPILPPITDPTPGPGVPNVGIYPDCDVNPYGDLCLTLDCRDPNEVDVGLGTFRSKKITIEWNVPDGISTDINFDAELWLLAHGHQPLRIGVVQPGAEYELTWDHSLDYNQRIQWGIRTVVDGITKWLFSDECCVSKDLNEVCFNGQVEYIRPEREPSTETQIIHFENDQEFVAAVGDENYVAEARAGNGTTGSGSGDFELRMSAFTGGPPTAQKVWTSGQEYAWDISYDPETREVTFTFDGEVMTYVVPPEMDPRTFALRAANSPTHGNTRVTIGNVFFNGTEYPELSLDTGYTGPGGADRKPVSNLFIGPPIRDGYTMSGTLTFEWDVGDEPTGSRLDFTAKFVNPPDIPPIYGPCDTQVATYENGTDFDADFGRIDYLAEIRWGNGLGSGDQELNFQLGTGGATVVSNQQEWRNAFLGEDPHEWRLAYDSLNDEVVFYIDGVEKLRMDSPSSEPVRTAFIFGVAKERPGAFINWKVDEFSSEQIDGAEGGWFTGAENDTGEIWGASVTIPPLGDGGWVLKGTVELGWDPGESLPTGSRILAHMKIGSVPTSILPVCESVIIPWDICLKITECCPQTCTKCYDNTVFCQEWHDESDFSQRAETLPGLPNQVLTTIDGDIQPLRQLALTRSADALNSELGLQHGSQKWIMVWDLELNRLVDFFPKQWLRYGAGFWFQHQTLRKGPAVDPNKTNRVPYYIEEFDLGLSFNGQGAFRLDRNADGQRTDGWSVPSRLIGLRRERQQQAPPRGYGNDTLTQEGIYAEFNHVSVDAFDRLASNAEVAERQRFFEDRKQFLTSAESQRYHDQMMFMWREAIARMLRVMQDGNEWAKNLASAFDPETPDTFGNIFVVLLNQISNKIMRSSTDRSQGIFEGTLPGNEEETNNDWLRYIYGEVRRLVEIEKIDKKDVQGSILEALTEVSDLTGQNFVDILRQNLDIQVIKEQYELAANGRVPPGSGVTDPDTDEENRIRGLAR